MKHICSIIKWTELREAITKAWPAVALTGSALIDSLKPRNLFRQGVPIWINSDPLCQRQLSITITCARVCTWRTAGVVPKAWQERRAIWWVAVRTRRPMEQQSRLVSWMLTVSLPISIHMIKRLEVESALNWIYFIETRIETARNRWLLTRQLVLKHSLQTIYHKVQCLWLLRLRTVERIKTMAVDWYKLRKS